MVVKIRDVRVLVESDLKESLRHLITPNEIIGNVVDWNRGAKQSNEVIKAHFEDQLENDKELWSYYEDLSPENWSDLPYAIIAEGAPEDIEFLEKLIVKEIEEDESNGYMELVGFFKELKWEKAEGETYPEAYELVQAQSHLQGIGVELIQGNFDKVTPNSIASLWRTLKSPLGIDLLGEDGFLIGFLFDAYAEAHARIVIKGAIKILSGEKKILSQFRIMGDQSRDDADPAKNGFPNLFRPEWIEDNKIIVLDTYYQFSKDKIPTDLLADKLKEQLGDNSIVEFEAFAGKGWVFKVSYKKYS